MQVNGKRESSSSAVCGLVTCHSVCGTGNKDCGCISSFLVWPLASLAKHANAEAGHPRGMELGLSLVVARSSCAAPIIDEYKMICGGRSGSVSTAKDALLYAPGVGCHCEVSM